MLIFGYRVKTIPADCRLAAPAGNKSQIPIPPYGCNLRGAG